MRPAPLVSTGPLPGLQLSAERVQRELRRAGIQEGERRRQRRWVVYLPLALLGFWSLAGSAIIVASAATYDPQLGEVLLRAGPAVWATGLLVSFVFWLLAVVERDLL